MRQFSRNLKTKQKLQASVTSNACNFFDVDFLLRQLPNSVDDIKIIIEEISPQRKYKGISTQIIGRIKNVRVPFNVDISVGDIIVPKAEFRKISTRLPEFEVPEVNTYSLESTIAEKLDAILQRFELTGRMKDFYDIYYLARTFDFDGIKLQTAIFETLQNRGTAYEKDSFRRIAQLADDADMQTKWKYFLKSIKDETLDFVIVISEIKVFLEPVYESIVGETEWQKMWNCINADWCDHKTLSNGY